MLLNLLTKPHPYIVTLKNFSLKQTHTKLPFGYNHNNPHFPWNLIFFYIFLFLILFYFIQFISLFFIFRHIFSQYPNFCTNISLRSFETIHIGIHITKILANPFIPVHQLFISGTLISTLYALTKQPAILLIYSFFPQSPYTLPPPVRSTPPTVCPPPPCAPSS